MTGSPTGRSPSLQIYAFNVVLDQPDAEVVFRNLLNRGNLPGTLYALCGLEFLLPGSLAALAEPISAIKDPVYANHGCIIDSHSVIETLADIKNRDLPTAFRRAYARAREIFDRQGRDSPSNLRLDPSVGRVVRQT